MDAKSGERAVERATTLSLDVLIGFAVAFIAAGYTAINIFGDDIVRVYEDQAACRNPVTEYTYDYRSTQQALFIAGVGLIVFGAIPWAEREAITEKLASSTRTPAEVAQFVLNVLGIACVVTSASMCLMMALTGMCQYPTPGDVQNDESNDVKRFSAVFLALMLSVALLLTDIRVSQSRIEMLPTIAEPVVMLSAVKIALASYLTYVMHYDDADFTTKFVDVNAYNATVCITSLTKINSGDIEHKRFEAIRLAKPVNIGTSTFQADVNERMRHLAYALVAATVLELLYFLGHSKPMKVMERDTTFGFGVAYRVVGLFNNVVVAIFAYVLILENSVVACPLFDNNNVHIFRINVLVVLYFAGSAFYIASNRTKMTLQALAASAKMAYTRLRTRVDPNATLDKSML